MSSIKDNVISKLNNLTENSIGKVDKYIATLNDDGQKPIEFRFSAPPSQMKLGEDLLSRSEPARILSSIILNDIVPPFTLGVFGKWGSGKTIFLDLLKQALITTDNNSCEVIEFNAWKYEATGNVVFALFKHIESKLPERIKKEKRNLEIGKTLIWVGTQVVQKYSGVDLKAKRIWQNIGKAGSELEKILNENYTEITNLHDNFSKCIREILTHNKKKMVVIIIDDLDRCDPENVVKILESIKNFLSTEGCVFVLSADRDAVAAGVRQKYGGSNNISGDEYLDKIVNLSFELSLNPQGELKSLIDLYQKQYPSLLGELKIDFITLAYQMTSNQNIRTAKRILDRYLLLVKYLRSKDVKDLNLETLYFGVILQELMPELYKDIKIYPRYPLVDRISVTSNPSGAMDLEKLSVTDRCVFKHFLQSNARDLINEFKKVHSRNAQGSQNIPLHTELSKCIKFIDTLTM